jgi:hypothetical protein
MPRRHTSRRRTLRSPSPAPHPWLVPPPLVDAITHDRIRRLLVVCEQEKRRYRADLLAGRAPRFVTRRGAAKRADERPANGPG